MAKIVIFWYFTKMEITQVQNDLESWNLAKLWTIILSKITNTDLTLRHCLYIIDENDRFQCFLVAESKSGVFLLHVLILLHMCSLFLENNRKSIETMVNCHILDNF